MFLIFGFETGNMIIAFHILMLIVWIIVENKKFSISNFTGLISVIVLGKFVTLCNYLFSLIVPFQQSLVLSFALLFIGIVLMSFGTYLYLKPGIFIMPVEGCIKSISNKMQKSFSFTKPMFDVLCTIVSIILCISLYHGLGSIGIGTVLTALFCGPIIAVFTKIEKHFNQLKNL